MFHGWDFYVFDLACFSREVIIGFNSNFTIIIVFCVYFGIFIELYIKELDISFSIINMYFPYEGNEIF
jgi:hypothetical protein